MKIILDGCDDIEDLVVGNEIFEARTRAIGIIPGELGAAYGVSGSNLRPRGSTGTSAATARRTSSTPSSTSRSGPTPTATLRPVLGAPPGDPRVGADGAAAARRDARRPSWPRCPHHQGAGGRGLGRDREPTRPDGLLRVSKGATGPFRVKIRSAPFSNVSILPWLLPAFTFPTSSRSSGQLYFILGDIDR